MTSNTFGGQTKIKRRGIMADRGAKGRAIALQNIEARRIAAYHQAVTEGVTCWTCNRSAAELTLDEFRTTAGILDDDLSLWTCGPKCRNVLVKSSRNTIDTRRSLTADELVIARATAAKLAEAHRARQERNPEHFAVPPLPLSEYQLRLLKRRLQKEAAAKLADEHNDPDKSSGTP